MLPDSLRIVLQLQHVELAQLLNRLNSNLDPRLCLLSKRRNSQATPAPTLGNKPTRD